MKVKGRAKNSKRRRVLGRRSTITSELVDKILLFARPSVLLAAIGHSRVYGCITRSPLVLNSLCRTDGLPLEDCKNLLPRRAAMRKAILQPSMFLKTIQTPQRDMTQMLVFNGNILTSSDDCTVCCFDMRGRLLRTYTGHRGGVWALDAVGDLLVTGSVDKTAIIWEMSTGTALKTLKAHRSTIRVLMATQSHIITGSRDYTVGVWSLGGDLLHLLSGHRDSVRCMDCDNAHLVTGSYDGTVRLWDYKSGRALRVLNTNRDRIYAVRRHRDHVASTGVDNIVEIVSIDGSFSAGHSNHTSHVVWLDFVGSYLVSSGADGQVVKYDYIKNTVASTILEAKPIKCQKISNNILIIGTLTEIKLYCFVTGTFIRTLLEARIISKIEVADNRIIVRYSRFKPYYLSIFEYDLGM